MNDRAADINEMQKPNPPIVPAAIALVVTAWVGVEAYGVEILQYVLWICVILMLLVAVPKLLKIGPRSL